MSRRDFPIGELGSPSTLKRPFFIVPSFSSVNSDQAPPSTTRRTSGRVSRARSRLLLRSRHFSLLIPAMTGTVESGLVPIGGRHRARKAAADPDLADSLLAVDLAQRGDEVTGVRIPHDEDAGGCGATRLEQIFPVRRIAPAEIVEIVARGIGRPHHGGDAVRQAVQPVDDESRARDQQKRGTRDQHRLAGGQAADARAAERLLDEAPGQDRQAERRGDRAGGLQRRKRAIDRQRPRARRSANARDTANRRSGRYPPPGAPTGAARRRMAAPVARHG